MTTSRSFDRAVSYYDQTRPLPEPVATQGIQSLVDIIGSRARLLEVGAGTGRISLPLLQRGVEWTGCDLSINMLRRLKEKFSAARIARADATYLPFPAASFDIVMTVHVLHLVPLWRDALREFKRLVRPAGAYLNVKTWAPAGVSTREQIRNHWRGWLEKKGVHAGNPGVQNSTELQQELRLLGAQVEEVAVIPYLLRYILREELERFEARIYSDAWDIPDAIFEASLEDLRGWVEAEYGSLDQPREDELRFAIEVARFDGGKVAAPEMPD